MGATVVFCLPHAGGGRHQYLSWAAAFEDALDWVPIEYPGHFTCEDEPCHQTFEAAVSALAEDIRARAAGDRIGLFGHSLGGSLAYEVGRRLRGYPEIALDSVVVSSAEPPSALRATRQRYFELDDEQLLGRLHDLNGLGASSPLAREILAETLPLIRSDYRLHHSYRPEPDTAIDVPLWICSGTEEELTAGVLGWQRHAAATIEFHRFAGGHFYWQTDPAPLIGLLRGIFTQSVVAANLSEEDPTCRC